MKLITLCFLAVTVSALPTRRASDKTVETVATHMQTALSSYLEGFQVSNFYALANGWKTIDFAGSQTDLSLGMQNNAAFYLADQIQNKSGAISYSQKMIAFIQDVNSAVTGNKNNTDNPAVTKAQKAYTYACHSGMNDVVTAVTEQYSIDQGVDAPSTSSPDFLQYASQDVSYQQASDECQSASNAYEKALSKAYGDDFYIFSGAMNNIKGILNPATVLDGETMSISSVKSPSGQKAGSFVPYYSIPTLNGTVSSWQSGDGGSSSGFNYTSSSANGSSSSTTTSGSGGVSFIWEEFSGSGSGSGETTKTSSNTTATSMTVTFGQIGLFGIESGIWNSLQVAEALQSPSDATSKKGVPVFNKYYGTSSSPGPLATWKDQALVVYQPSFTVQFATAAQASDFHQTQASASACFLFICVGGSGSSMSNSTSYEEGSTLVTYKDPSKKAYLVGFTQASFFDQSKQDSASTDASSSDV